MVTEFERGIEQKACDFSVQDLLIHVVGGAIMGAPISVAGYTPKERFLWQDLEKLNSRIGDELTNLAFVPALRGLDSPQYALGDKPFDELANTAGVTQQAHILSTTLAYRRELEEQISSIMSNVVQRNIRARLTPNRSVMIESNNNGLWVPITNEGMGSNPLLHLVAQLVLAPDNSLVMIEEPEIHLHPDAQTRLAKELIRFVKTTNKRLIITTHSDQLIYPLFNSVRSNADRQLTKDDLVIYYFNRNNEGNTEVKELSKDNFSDSLRTFFTKDNFVVDFLEAIGRV